MPRVAFATKNIPIVTRPIYVPNGFDFDLFQVGV